jgi:hypothetical protein
VKYLVWSYDYAHASGGPKVLNRLCHELNEAGQEAYIGNGYRTNPEWNTPNGVMDDDTIAIYPEVVSGNPWEAKHVVRWVLNVPGLLGGDTSYDPAETVFTWDQRFLAGAPLLHLPAIETDIYTDRREPRAGELYYVGKGYLGAPEGAAPITHEMRADRHALADALNRATLLRCFDETTAMVQIAFLCGCPVIVNGRRLEPNGFRDEYLAQWSVFQAQLADFIRITQGVPA